ncbi:MAG: hypothetical protein HC831_01890 [Chloroflexia bacterium]|nr:hypothetical protein [Chloroflexia bacterium]
MHSHAQSNSSSNWKLVKNQNDIKIYLRKHHSSSLKEALGVMKMKTHLCSIIALLKDTQNHKSWLFANKSSKILKHYNDSEWILYTQSEAPWPILDRDLISHTRMYQNENNCEIKIKSYAVPNYIKKEDGLVRIEEMNSEWTFTPLADGYVEIRFNILINLGGALPVWLTNFAVDKGPYNTLLKMKKALSDKKYQEATLPYIKENCQECSYSTNKSTNTF